MHTLSLICRFGKDILRGLLILSLSMLCFSTIAYATNIPILSGDTMTGNITVTGQVDTYTFSANSGDAVTILMGRSSATFFPKVELHAPHGTVVATAGAGSSFAMISAQKLNQTGTYFILCRALVGDDTGTYAVSLTHVRQLIPIISVMPSALNFGTVRKGTDKELTLTVKNIGLGTLIGNATTAAPFSIVSGGSYSLDADQSQVVTIRYQPTSLGTHSGAVVFTGEEGVTVPVTGNMSLPWLLLLLGN